MREPAMTDPMPPSLLDLVFHDAHVGRCLVGPDGTVQRVNAEWLRATGFALQDVLGADVIELFPETRDLSLALHARARAGHHVEVSRHAQRVGERETWWEGSIDPVAMAGGTGLLITAREVTDRGYPDAAPGARRDLAGSLADVARNEERLRLLVANVPFAVAMFDREMRYLAVSRRYTSEHHLPPQDLVGRSHYDVFPEIPERWKDIHRRCLAGAVARSDEDPFPRADGTVDWTRWEIVPWRDGTGEIGGVILFLEDITARKRAEDALRAANEQLRLVQDAARIGAWDWNLETGELNWSEQCKALFGIPAGAAMSYDLFLRAVHEEDRGSVDAAVRRALHGGSRYEVELRTVHPDGAIRWITSTGQAYFGPGGEPVRMSGMAYDITDRKRAEEEVRLADQRKSEFLGVLSHELRNPLAPIRNSVYVLDRAPPGSEQAARARDVIRRQSEHLTRLVDDLLDVTRISRGKIVLQRARVDLREVVLRTADDMRSVFAQAGVELRVDRLPGPVWIDADPTRVAQVLGNLLQNAVKFTPAGGAVAVTVTASERDAELRVRDTGVGMIPGTVERMFEPFVQADQTLARTRGGLGLGLALVKGLVELHGGRVEARSEGLGRGAELVVRLPLTEQEEAPDRTRPVDAAASSRTVLVIEDNLDAGYSLADMLELNGYRVKVARDGRAGIALARELRPDVVLCDIGLPDVDGYDVARALRGDASLRATRLVALSGYAQPEDRDRARDAGFDAHVAKPPDLDELTRVLAGR